EPFAACDQWCRRLGKPQAKTRIKRKGLGRSWKRGASGILSRSRATNVRTRRRTGYLRKIESQPGVANIISNSACCADREPLIRESGANTDESAAHKAPRATCKEGMEWSDFALTIAATERLFNCGWVALPLATVTPRGPSGRGAFGAKIACPSPPPPPPPAPPTR